MKPFPHLPVSGCEDMSSNGVVKPDIRDLLKSKNMSHPEF